MMESCITFRCESWDLAIRKTCRKALQTSGQNLRLSETGWFEQGGATCLEKSPVQNCFPFFLSDNMDWRRRLEEKQISEVRAGGSRFYPDWIFEQQKQGAAVGKSKNKVKAGHGTKPLDSLDVRLITYQLDGRTKLYNFTFPLCCSWRRFIINYFWALADLKVFFKSFVLALWNPASLHSSQPGRNLRLLNFQNPSTKLCFCH